jgi:tape measure domain-containing protein
MTDIAQLGFQIDTAGLKQGAQAADQLATSLNKVADAADKQAGAERRKTTTTQQSTQATQQAAQAAQAHATAATAQEGATAKVGATLGTLGGVLSTVGTQTQSLTGQLTNLSGVLAGGAGGGAGGVVGGLNAMAGGMGKLGGTLGPVAAGILGVGAGITALIAGFGAAVAATFKTQEQFLILEGRLKNVYGSAAAASDAMARITKLAQENGVAVQATAEAYLRLARNNEAIGLSRVQMTELTDAVQKLGRVSGASTGELASGMLQFSQALAAGRLNGDELRSIMENMPALAKAIAQGLGVSVGQLRAMGAEGQLTSDKIVNSLLGQLPKINAEFKNLPQTSEQAFARIGSAWDRLIAGMGQRLNASKIVTTLGNAAASAIDGVAGAVTPENDNQRMDRILRERIGVGNTLAQNSFLPARQRSRIGVSSSENPEFEGRFLTDLLKAQAQEELDAINAPVVRSQAIIQEIDNLGTKAKGIREQIKTLEDAVGSLIKQGDLTKAKQYGDFIEVLKRQLEGLRSPLDAFRRDTERQAQDIARFGAGGAASIGAEARNIVKQGEGSGVNIGEQQAINAVLERRASEIERTAAAMEIEIDAQRRLTDTAGQGARAQIEAEVAQKAYNLQMQLAGREITPQLSAALEKYKENLRELLSLQKENTDAQRLYNAQQELGIQRALSAAQANGANAGQLRELERQLRLNVRLQQELGASGGGGAPVTSGVPLISARPMSGRAAAEGGETISGAVRAGVNTTGMTSTITAVVAEIQRLFPGAVVTSGRRNGDGGSQHDHGNAADFSLRNLSQDERARLVKMLASGQGSFAGVGGLGMYDARGDLLHVDTRGGQRMAWGPNRSHSSLGQTPEFFQDAVNGWRGTINGQISTATRAITTEDDSERTRALREGEARIAAMRREIEETRRQATAPDAVSARRRQQEDQARSVARDFEPGQQEVAYQTELLKLRAQDRAEVAERTRSMEEGLKSQERITAAIRRGGAEGRIQLQLEKEINDARERGVELTEQEVAAKEKVIRATVEQEKVNSEAKSQAAAYENMWLDVADSIGGAIEGAFREAVMTGKVDAERLLKGLVADIGSAIIRATIVQPLVSGISSFFAAVDGAAFQGGQKMAFAGGGVVGGPRMFAMAGGTGLMGEAGPEAIMPLKRGPDGKLGVSAGSGGGGGGGVSIQINDMRTGSDAAPIETEEKQGANGERAIQIMVRDEVKRQIGAGELDGPMRTNYGTTRILTKR